MDFWLNLFYMIIISFWYFNSWGQFRNLSLVPAMNDRDGDLGNIILDKKLGFKRNMIDQWNEKTPVKRPVSGGDVGRRFLS